MDSQQQYEALLAKWGYADTTAADYARRQKRELRMKEIVSFFKTTFLSLQKSGTNSLGQASA